MTSMVGRDSQSVMAGRWERRRASRPSSPGPPKPVPARQWRLRQLVRLLLTPPGLVAVACVVGPKAALVFGALCAVCFSLGEWMWRLYLRPRSLD